MTLSAQQRLDWPDIAKGLSILGVVVLHVSLAVPGGMDTMLAHANRLLDPLRMPLFFLVSGFFSAKVLRLSFADLFLKRLWFFIVPYVFWGPIELWLKFREYHLFDGSPMPVAGKYVEYLAEGRTMYWFLLTLIVFNLILWAVRKLNPGLVFLVALVPLVFLPFQSEHLMFGRLVLYLPPFLIGAYLRDRIAAFAAEGASVRNVVGSSALYVAAFVASLWFSIYHANNDVDLPWFLPGAEYLTLSEARVVVISLVQMAMIPMALVVAVLLAKIKVVARVLKFLGHHTLVIYLGHPMALTVLFHYNVRNTDLAIARDAPMLWEHTAFWMVVGLIISAIGSYTMWLISNIPVIGWTIKPPALAGRVNNAATRASLAEPLVEEPAHSAGQKPRHS
ncbi:Acyltransferase family protein [Corynebacterium atrinae]|uniref:acyltransferase family protein n=1 Tax=Corynebacterium atrinae TaxID=1336740 RepID=UPI0025B35482|nr:acyltransferase family protein [Corynebacterium atrinae]WJY63833.1 Acyltransferase family protein [Corynebacterium atrinae]